MEKLTALNCSNREVADLTPLKDLKELRFLWCVDTKVADLSPLRGMNLEVLLYNVDAKRDGEILRSLKKLKIINEKPVRDFWKEVEAKKPKKQP
jgi:Leucine-rich repeat (LRR) protein